MKSDTVDLDTHTGLSIILGLRPEGKEISVKVPKTVDELIEIMTPYKNSDKTLLIDCGGFDSDLYPYCDLPLQTALLFLQKTP
uniref:ParA family protein n=1 Tax=Escherichia coli TaxID=562 RepID=A0A3G4RTG8_ECOLX|nr:ParA family protein [Escherichia coli]